MLEPTTNPMEAAATEIEAQGQEESQQEEQTEQQPPQKVFKKVKVDGQEIEVDEDELLSGYQRAAAANKRFQEASAERKKAEELFGKLKNDPWKAMQELGLSPRQLAEEYLIQQLESEQKEAALTPEQKKIRELEIELEKKAKFEEETKKAEDSRKFQEEVQKHQLQYQKEFTEALEKVKLPRNPTTLKRIAEKIYSAADAGYDMSAVEAAKLVEEEFMESLPSLFKDMDDESLLRFLGSGIADRIRKHNVSQLKNPKPTQTSSKSAQSQKDSKPKTLEDFLAKF